MAVDGVDGWNAVRAGDYHLVISDVDMPRMDGIALVRSIKQDPRLKSIPVVIVSYKDREEDRMRGLDAGADGYLTKSSFHDRTFLDAVADLIGEGRMRMRIGMPSTTLRRHPALGRVVGLEDAERPGRHSHGVPWERSRPVDVRNRSRPGSSTLPGRLAGRRSPRTGSTGWPRRGVEKARDDRPDLILMDLIMPGGRRRRGDPADHGGLCPCPIVIVTSSVSGHMGRVYEAMGLGALDAVDTPELGPSGDLGGARFLLDKIATIAKLVGRAPRMSVGRRRSAVARPAPRRGGPLVAAGGRSARRPAARRPWPRSSARCRRLDRRGDGDRPARRLGLRPGLARWLAERTGRRVELIEPGDQPLPGKVFLAATNDHVILDESRRFRYVAEPAEMHYRPSVDVFFRSVAEHWPEPGGARS